MQKRPPLREITFRQAGRKAGTPAPAAKPKASYLAPDIERELARLRSPVRALEKTRKDWARITGMALMATTAVFGMFYLSEEVLPRAPLPVVKRPPPPPQVSYGVSVTTAAPDIDMSDLPPIDVPTLDEPLDGAEAGTDAAEPAAQ